MVERLAARELRAHLNDRLVKGEFTEDQDALTIHLLHGLAYTAGSALGSTPPTQEQCLSAFLVPNKVGLTAGARAWSKHAHRSGGSADSVVDDQEKDRKAAPSGWWGTPRGPIAGINEHALVLFRKIMGDASWRNLHWLPHGVLVYEVRVPEGYGMRWAQDLSGLLDEQDRTRVRVECEERVKGRPWIFRGFVEPMMENGHEVGWRH
ncbi:uncharacterized protein PHACADRAFT_86202 [Phanerochaete carnosa HHB-10118-sp]|uniref:Uncharacterized protein n=1 Tax=Phanerochaete carnosa (strain HHB-10118-sp) TaxID=650164 RepID=K5WHE5_PHACS|nr:uncharacterized protein PHACADRAFT_86202 [Phanerochaete carnosa HHB-10118-sp]EKM58750.1 hypothetical protein PHACADRAFT_86202 [Phanerochaete carnosa HHB-10118-sp]